MPRFRAISCARVGSSLARVSVRWAGLALFLIMAGRVEAQRYRAVVLDPAPGVAWTIASGAGDPWFSGYGAFPDESFPNQCRALLFKEGEFLDVTPPGMGAIINDSDGEQHVGGATPHQGYPSHAYLWLGTTPIDLHPAGYGVSEALGAGGGRQVGYVHGSFSCAECGRITARHAALWNGSAESVRLLHSRAHDFASAHGTDGSQQVGWGVVASGYSHALLWNGPTSLAIDLHPAGDYEYSIARAVSGGEQVGYLWGPATDHYSHAALWRGSAASFVDLHPEGYDRSEIFAASGGVQVGRGSLSTENWMSRALAWKGTAESVIDLHALLPEEFESWHSSAEDLDAAGNVVGYVNQTDRWRPVIWYRTDAAPVAGAGGAVPARVTLGPVVPNPSAGATSFAVGLAAPATIELAIHDLQGRRLTTFARTHVAPGWTALHWEGRDDGGRAAEPGIYFARLLVGGVLAASTRFVVRP